MISARFCAPLESVEDGADQRKDLIGVHFGQWVHRLPYLAQEFQLWIFFEVDDEHVGQTLPFELSLLRENDGGVVYSASHILAITNCPILLHTATVKDLVLEHSGCYRWHLSFPGQDFGPPQSMSLFVVEYFPGYTG
jgi:hypothetical protein